jgi:DNA-binding MarR family transcriptional regulator
MEIFHMSEMKKEILEQFIRLQGLLHRYHTQHFMEFGPLGNPHRGQGRVLSILKMKPEMSQKELTYLLDMSKQGLAELLNKLEKKGYIKREPVEEDRRSFNIILTEEGAAVAGEIDDNPLDLDKVFDCLSDEELAKLNEYLQRIIECLENQLPGDDNDLRKQMMEKFMEHYLHGKHEDDLSVLFRGRFPHGRGGRKDDDDRKRTMERFMEHHLRGKHVEDFSGLFEGRFPHEWGGRIDDDDRKEGR